MFEDDNYVEPEDLDKLEDLMERVGESEEKIEKALKAAGTDPETFEDLMEVYTMKASQVATKDEFYPYEDLAGEFKIGENPEGNDIGLTREQLNEHILAVSMTGKGKTTFLYNLIETLRERSLPFIVFDFKNDYRHLAKKYEDLLVINWRDMKFNPLEPPPEVSPGKWGEILADTFCHATDLLIGSESYFLEKLNELYEIYNVEEEGKYPSVFELKELVEMDAIAPASPRFKYKERNQSRLSMFTGFSGEIFDCSSGIPLQELLDRNVIFELKEPNQFVSNFFVETVLTWIYYYRDAMGQREKLRHVVMFDEAKRVFDVMRERQPEAGWPPIDDIVGKVREFGEALAVADHEPSKLTDSIKANTNVKIWMSLGSGKDIEEMARTFGLGEDEEIDYTRTMEKGNALLKIADREPVPIFLPDYQIDKDVSEEEIREKMEPEIQKFEWKKRYRPEAFLEKVGGEEEDEEREISEAAEELLVDVKENPLLKTAERYDKLDFDTKKGGRAREELLENELIKEVEVRTGTRGRNPKIFEITPEGRKHLRAIGLKVREPEKGGAEHRWWQRKVQEHYQGKGYDSFIEYYMGRKSIDVYSVKEGKEVATEIALSPEHELENVKKCLDKDFDTVQVVYNSESVKEKIEGKIRDWKGEIPGKILFSHVSEFS